MLFTALAFIYLYLQINTSNLNVFDSEVINFFSNFHTIRLTAFMKIVTFIGDSIGYLLFVSSISVFFIFKKSWRTAIQVSVILVLASGLNIVLKLNINRPRPISNRLVEAKFTSFPSGHAMSAVVFYGFIIYLCVILIKSKWLKNVLIVLSILMILLIGISRIYLGVHYPSDVLAGYLVGISWLLFCIIVLNILTLWKQKREKQAESN